MLGWCQVWVQNSPKHGIEREVQAPWADVPLQGIHPTLQHRQQVCLQVPWQLLRRALEQLRAQPAGHVRSLPHNDAGTGSLQVYSSAQSQEDLSFRYVSCLYPTLA